MPPRFALAPAHEFESDPDFLAFRERSTEALRMKTNSNPTLLVFRFAREVGRPELCSGGGRYARPIVLTPFLSTWNGGCLDALSP